jgi:hypothetical protein
VSAEAEVITRLEDLAPLQEDWEEMRLENGASIFTSYLWTTTWLRHFGGSVGLRALVLREGGEVAGIAPFATFRSRFLGLPVTYLCMVGTVGETTEYHDLQPLYKGEAKRAARDFVKGMRSIRWNMLQLRDLRWCALMENLFSQAGAEWPCEKMASKPCPFAVLDPQKEVLEQFEGRSSRKVRRIVNELQRDGRISFVKVWRKEEVERSVDVYIEQHKARWASKGGSIFNDPRQTGFLKEIASRSAERDEVIIYEIHIDGKVASQQLCIRDGRVIRMYKIGMNDEFRSYAPGYLSVYYAMSDARYDGFREFDLGPGQEEYKYKAGGKDRFMYNIQGKRGSMKLLSTASRLPGARRVARRVLPTMTAEASAAGPAKPPSEPRS